MAQPPREADGLRSGDPGIRVGDVALRGAERGHAARRISPRDVRVPVLPTVPSIAADRATVNPGAQGARVRGGYRHSGDGEGSRHPEALVERADERIRAWRQI